MSHELKKILENLSEDIIWCEIEVLKLEGESKANLEALIQRNKVLYKLVFLYVSVKESGQLPECRFGLFVKKFEKAMKDLITESNVSALHSLSADLEDGFLEGDHCFDNLQ